MKERLRHLRSLLAESGFDAVCISSPANIVYFSGFSGFSSHERDGYLFITEKAAYILTSSLYADAVNQLPHLTLLTYTNEHPLQEQLTRLVTKHGVLRVGFEADNLTVAEWKRFAKLFKKSAGVNLRTIRIRKSAEEIAAISKAARIADEALKATLSTIRPGIIEVDLARTLEDRIRMSVSDVAFPTIVAFGQNAAIPHHKSGATRLKKNDLILIDFGAVSGEYRSDMTRTFFIGRATEEQKKAYQAVLEAQNKACEYIVRTLSSSPLPSRKNYPNDSLSLSERVRVRVRVRGILKAAAVDKVARDFLVSRGYPSIPHSLGHGTGLAVHEAPSLSPNSKDTLEEGMVFSIEPGVYFPGRFGIRIEDLYTIKNGKLQQLTHYPSRLIEI